MVDTLGGRIHVRWDQGAAATPHGQLVFFAEFLAATGVFERWVSACPLAYRSGNAPDKRDVLGTLMLGLLAGHRRYAHITALRGDAVAAQALGMNKVVSEDALRRALERIDEPSSTAWLRPALMHSVREALDRPWVLDIDTSIKPLYGRQQGAELGYNPAKPARPSHALHTFWVGNLRLVLDVQVSSEKQHTSGHAKAALGRLLDELGDKRPTLVRGDSGYGNEGILLELEGRGQPYLLRLRQTANVQRLVAQQFARQDWSRPDSQGCQMVEGHLQLLGWSKKRRVVVVRQRIKGGIARERRVDGKQLKLSERAFQTHQGRLPQELARAGITTREGANRYLEQVYRQSHYREFGVPSTLPGTAYVPFLNGSLPDILYEQHERTVGNDNCVSFEGMSLQLPADELRHHYVRTKVRVHRYVDATLAVFHGPRKLAAYDQQGTPRVPEEALRAAA